MVSSKLKNILILLDIILFVLVVIILLAGMLATTLGLAVLLIWVIIFFATLMVLTMHITQGGDEWYNYGIMFSMGILIAMVAGIILSFDIYGIALLIPFSVVGTILINWMFTDSSETAIEKDLKKLQRELK